ncbi:ABC transporter ATP-binding protein [Marinobacter mobilis]|uniref:ABC-2 type transport system ATP-binding protein n=1 Tax=Marinobacter mobilis TaxID=488533 RepID=A0A1H3BTQ1_9GAMM|nr:ABC transporter ATP-binding protein [Marinobacter mobilis]SDX45105.1 ABC-2 type transport system ATP-binding protein [Marinobacter mobilis]
MTDALEIQGLTKTYDDGFEALKGIDLRVEQGDFFALLGPNGAGKSTTLGIVSSLVNKSGGSVRVFGHDIDTDLSAAKLNLGVVPQEFNFNQFEKVQDIVTTQAGYYGIPLRQASKAAEKYLRKLGLWDKRDTPARMLSGGMKRRLMIARALVHEPGLLILDEPTAGVDIELRRSMWAFLEEMNRQGTTIILTTHYLEEAEALCRNIAIIDHGQILRHTSKRELLQQLHLETFVLDVSEPLAEPPALEGFSVRVTGEGALEVDVEKSRSLNEVFVQLEARGIRVMSMRTKANRLEELFIRMVEENSEQAGEEGK